MKHHRYKIGIIGLGLMGYRYLQALAAHDRWKVVSVCDLDEQRLDLARKIVPAAEATNDASEVVENKDLDVVGVFTLSNVRPRLIEKSLEYGKHVMAEKPLADSIAREKDLLRKIEESGRLVAVNLFNRNAWYHEQIREFIRNDEIGRLGVITISHQTAGLMPTEGHQPEGPPFHDCGMHYVDVARWYAGSDYDEWHAQGIRMWSWRDPWWINVHGRFRNGTVFAITQGFIYGQLAETKTCRCGLDAIGTKGVVRMQHDFKTVRIEFHGVDRTEVKEGPYGGKKIDIMCDRFARALDTGELGRLPTARDSVIASEVSQAMLEAASKADPPCVGTAKEMEEILAHRRNAPMCT